MGSGKGQAKRVSLFNKKRSNKPKTINKKHASGTHSMPQASNNPPAKATKTSSKNKSSTSSPHNNFSKFKGREIKVWLGDNLEGAIETVDDWVVFDPDADKHMRGYDALKKLLPSLEDPSKTPAIIKNMRIYETTDGDITGEFTVWFKECNENSADGEFAILWEDVNDDAFQIEVKQYMNFLRNPDEAVKQQEDLEQAKLEDEEYHF